MKRVRLSEHDRKALETVFHQYFLEEDHLWLFGSRTNLTKKGGDIDLYIETHAKSVEEAIKRQSDFISGLHQKIGDQKIDIILNMLNFPYPIPIHKVAKSEGERIV